MDIRREPLQVSGRPFFFSENRIKTGLGET
jgi:hypothetical protein